MKKILSLIMIISLLASFAACGGDGDASSVDTASKESSRDTAEGSGVRSEEVVIEGSNGIESVISNEPVEDSEASTITAPTISDVSADYGTSVSDKEVLSEKAYTVYVVNNGDGTCTVKALIPAKVGSGKIVVSASKNLSLVSGSLSTAIEGGVINEKYNRNGVEGACVVFASSATFPKATVAFTASYTIAEGATISEKDISVNEWNLTSGTGYLGTSKDSKVVIRYVQK